MQPIIVILNEKKEYMPYHTILIVNYKRELDYLMSKIWDA